MSDQDLEAPDDDLLAAELVLGVLNAAERRSAQARSESDPVFAQRIGRWERRLQPWLTDIEPVAAPAHLWTQICQRLGWQENVSARGGLWQSLAFWRAAAALAGMAAIVAIWVARLPAPAPQAPVAVVQPGAAESGAIPVTTLVHEDGSPGWLASVDRVHGSVLMVPVPGHPDAQGRVPELWLIPPGKAPRSLGLLPIDKTRTVAVPADVRAALGSGSLLAITLEPPGGAPHGAPTGPIIAKGAIQI
jgi:anti-sigma-K factor RskA